MVLEVRGFKVEFIISGWLSGCIVFMCIFCGFTLFLILIREVFFVVGISLIRGL